MISSSWSHNRGRPLSLVVVCSLSLSLVFDFLEGSFLGESLKLLPGKVVAMRLDDISCPNFERRKKRWDQSVEDLVCLGSGEVRRLVRKHSSSVRC